MPREQISIWVKDVVTDAVDIAARAIFLRGEGYQLSYRNRLIRVVDA